MATKQETGAPANLKRLESHEADAESQVARLKLELAKLRDQEEPEGDEAKRQHKQAIVSVQDELQGAYDLWFKLSKQLREFDKSVAAERREGEKVTVAEAREIFQQLILTIDLALESYAIASSQEMFRCQTPQEVHLNHAENWRTAKTSAIETAKRDSVLPKWILEFKQ